MKSVMGWFQYLSPASARKVSAVNSLVTLPIRYTVSASIFLTPVVLEGMVSAVWNLSNRIGGPGLMEKTWTEKE